jgi:hypothetical protein
MQLNEGAILRNPYEFKNLRILGNATVNPNIIENAPYGSVDIKFENVTLRTLNSATAPLIESLSCNITLNSYSIIENSSGAKPIKNSVGGSNFNFFINDNSVIQNNTLDLVGIVVSVYLNSSALI